MGILNSVVTIQRVPTLVVETGTDWVTLGGFALTLSVFVLGTFLTIRNFNKTTVSQENIASKNNETLQNIAAMNTLKSNRQTWINDLRNTCAQYISAILNVQRLNNYYEARKAPWLALQAENPEEHSRLFADWAADHVNAMKEVKFLKAKIELLLNPDEVDSKQLLTAVLEAQNKCDAAGNGAARPCELIVEHCQVILKQEWERVKAGT